MTLRLVTTDDNDCRRYHVDRLAQATWAPDEGIIHFGEPSQFEPFWMGILKGDAYPGNAGYGLVHRSPPITGSGQTRVLFCLDC